VCVCVCVCVFVHTVGPAKAAEPIETLFEM